MKKVGIVVQRYGSEVNGGAEYHARILAEKLSSLFEVEILTSCAKDHFTWANEYAEGCTEINAVNVRRFKTPHQRNKKKVHRLANMLMDRSFTQKILRFFRFDTLLRSFFPLKRDYDAIGEEWSKQQGPFVPGLIAHIKRYQDDYDAFIFFTYLYFPTFAGLKVAPHKSILIPTAHDEPAIHFPVFQSFFQLPKVILYNTLSEKKLVNRLFNNQRIYSDVVGLGIDSTVVDKQCSAADILNSCVPYFIYIGRIDPGKGCDRMINFFLSYKTSTERKVHLVLVGKSFMDIPVDDAIIHMGFVQENIKQTLLRGAQALIMPSLYESLSLVTLESMLAGVPVIANGDCEVLKDHIEKSKAGFTFTSLSSFNTALDVLLLDNADLAVMKANGRKYVREHYNWTLVLDKIAKAVDVVTG